MRQQSLGGCEKHSIRYPAGLANEHAQTHAGEDEHVVTLPDDVLPALEADRFEWRTGSYQCSALRMNQSLSGSALRLARGIAQRKNNRPLTRLSHGSNNCGSEITRLSRGSDQNRRPQSEDNLFEVVRQRVL